MNKRINKKALFSLILIIAVIIGAAVIYLMIAEPDSGPSIQSAPSTQSPFENIKRPDDDRVMIVDIVLPLGELVVTKEREAYQDGLMRIVIPKIDLDCSIVNGTALDVLEGGPGLYENGQTPNLYNTNTSIAGHRDIAGAEFEHLDQMADGDFIYLVYRDKVFRYLYYRSEIVTPENWDPIRVYADCRVTLTTCDPIGTVLNRLIVTGRLVALDEYGPEYDFK